MTPLVWKDTITIYNYYQTKNGNESYKRTILKRCFFNEDSIARQDKLGTQVVGSATVFIPHTYNNGYIKAQEWFNRSSGDLDGIWTVFNGTDKRATILVNYACDFEFTEATGRDFLNQIKEFEKEHFTYKKAMLVDNNDFGSKAMQHVKVRC